MKKDAVKRSKSSLCYVNFAPYDNAGRVLDYCLANFKIVLHFSYDHLRLKKGRRSQLTLYRSGKKILHKKLLWLRTPRILLFPSLPFVALFIFIQTTYYTYKLSREYGPFDYYLSVNGFTSFIGIFLKKLQCVYKTVFWVWDYFPANYPDIRLQIARKVYWVFDRPSRTYSDAVYYLNKRLYKTRIHQNGRKVNDAHIIPIGTNPHRRIPIRRTYRIGHMGMLKKGQGLDFLFDAAPYLKKLYPSLKIDIIGSGPDEDHYRKRTRRYRPWINFYGYIPDDNKVDKIIRSWRIGIATYCPEPWSEHYYTDPSKMKAYINQGVPIITTDVSPFADVIAKNRAGIIVSYDNISEFISAAKKIFSSKLYEKRAHKLALEYEYTSLYPRLFR